MNILCIDYDGPFHASPGGQYYSTKNLIFPLQANHVIKIFTQGLKRNEERLFEGVTYVGAGAGESRRDQLAFMMKARRYVAADQWHDLIIEHFSSPIGPIGLPRLTKKPVVGFADFSFWQAMQAKYHLPLSVIAKRLLPQYQWVVVHSLYDKQVIQAQSPQTTVVHIPNYVSNLPPYPVQEFGDASKKSLLFIGRPDWHQKGIDLLITILNKVSIDASITIAGFEVTHPMWQKYARAYSGTNPLQVVGYIRGDQKYQLFRQSDMVLLPSRYENHPFVSIEASHFGKPVVAFNLPSYEGHHGGMVLVPPWNTAAFAQSIHELYTDPARYKRLRHESIVKATELNKRNPVGEFHKLIEGILNNS